MFRRKRSKSGSAIAEFGPAMFLLVMIFFFPFLDLIALALSYGDCLYLNSLLLRQASLEQILVPNTLPSPPAPPFTFDYSCSTSATGSLNNIINQWMASGLGQFASSGVMPTQSIYVDLSEGTKDSNGHYMCEYVHLTLDVQCKPFVPVPFFVAVPGLNAPMTFEFHGRSVLEYIPS